VFTAHRNRLGVDKASKLILIKANIDGSDDERVGIEAMAIVHMADSNDE
jgi:hypothetical protein